MKPTDFSKSLTDFLTKYLPGQRGMSYHTISSYKITFILFITYMKDQKKVDVNKLMLKDITRNSVSAFLDWLQKERKSSDATRNVRLAALHSFFHYLQYESPEFLNEWQRILSIKPKRADKRVINYLTIDGIKLLLRQPVATTKKGLRDLAILSLMYDSAARVSEIINLTPAMVRMEKPNTIKLIGKGSKARIVPLMEKDMEILSQYMINNGLLEKSNSKIPLFYNSRKEKLTRAGLHYILQQYADTARKKDLNLIPDKLSCHCIRHSKAMHLLQAGINLVYIRDILGHRSVETTEIYARVDSKQKREALEKAYVDVITKESPIWDNNLNLLTWLKDFK
jgi:integrase/recombinase XerD